MESDQPALEQIAQNGDLIFIVGPEKQKVQVNSAIMKDASPVFAAMLGPNFREGQQLLAADEEPVTIELPEDDSKPFITIAKVVHKHEDVKGAPEMDDLFAIAYLVDKYNFAKSMEEVVDAWIVQMIPPELGDYEELLWKLLVAAYILDCTKAFARTSRELLLQQTEPYWNLTKITPFFEPAFKLAYALEEIKTTVRSEYLNMITIELYQDMHRDAGVKCPYNDRMFMKFFLQYMSEYQVDIDGWTRLDMLLENFTSFNYKKCKTRPENFDCLNLHQHKSEKYWGEWIRECAEFHNEKLYGLCLKCFKEGKHPIVHWRKPPCNLEKSEYNVGVLKIQSNSMYL